MELGAIVIAYNYSNKQLYDKIKHYIEDVEILIIWNNTPSNQNRLNNSYWKNMKCPVAILGTGENVGIGKALNESIKFAKNFGCTHVLTMDQDSEWRDFSKYRHSVESWTDKKIGIYAPIIADARSSKIFCCNKENRYAITSGSILNLEAYATVGGFNENFFIDEVDNEYCVRLSKAGYGIKIIKESFLFQEFGADNIRHSFTGKAANTYSAFRLYYQIRNRLWMLRLHFADLHWRYIVYSIVNVLMSRFVDIVLYEENKGEKIKAYLRGLNDGLFGKI